MSEWNQAEIGKRLGEYLTQQESNPLLDAGSPLCVTVSKHRPDGVREFFLQIYGGTFNFSHRDDDPAKDEILGGILDEVEGLEPDAVELEPGVFVLVPIENVSTATVERLLLRLLRDYLGIDENLAGVSMTAEDFGGAE